MSFDSEVSKAIKQMEKDATRAIQNRTARTMRKIVFFNGTRAFDTGLLVNSWEASVGQPFFNEEGNGAGRSRQGPESQKRIDGIQKKIKIGEDVFFTNSIHYANINESRTGFLASGVRSGGGVIKNIDGENE